MKTEQFKSFAGVRNDISPERFAKEDLQGAVNIELDETGQTSRRLGVSLIDATAAHSLWAEGEACLCVRAGTLHRVNADLTFTNLNVAVTGRLSYQKVGADVYFSDGLISGIYNVDDGCRLWGVPVPTTPLITTGVGQLDGGTYLVTITFVRSNGLEGGAAKVQAIYAADNSSMTIPFPACADPLVDTVRLYCSDRNGELPYLVGSVPLSAGTATIREIPASRSVPLRTANLSPLLTGAIVGYYNGRTYVARENFLLYSQPYEYELTNLGTNYIGFPSPIRTFAAVNDGIYIGLDNATLFLQGDDPAAFVQRDVAPFGTVMGTETVIPAEYFKDGSVSTPVQAWMSKQGLCAGLDGGQMVNLTGGRYVLPEGVATGASLLKVRGGSPQLVTTLFS